VSLPCAEAANAHVPEKICGIHSDANWGFYLAIFGIQTPCHINLVNFLPQEEGISLYFFDYQ